MEWLAAFYVYIKSAFPASDLAYITALAAALTVFFSFFKRVREITRAFVFIPIKNFFSAFSRLTKRVTYLERRIYGSGIEERLSHMEEVGKEDHSQIKAILTKLTKQISDLITSSKSTDKRISKLESFQRSILNISDIPTFETDANGSCTFINNAYIQLVGRQFDDLKKYGWLNIVHPDDRARVKEEWRSAYSDKRSFEHRFRIVCKEGVIYSVLCETHPIIVGNDDGDADGYIGHLEDVVQIGKMKS